jgi:RimJ/RimL family protein N-acetyltransferase
VQRGADPPLPPLTARLRLRALREEDLENLYLLYNDPRVANFVGAHTRAEVESELDFDIAHQAEQGWSMWAVEHRRSGSFLGVCGLRPLEMRGPEVELGYDLRPEAWGRGLATEAARATVGLALGALAIDRVVAVVKPSHTASRRVLETAGLVHTGAREAYDEHLLFYEITAGGITPSCESPSSGG